MCENVHPKVIVDDDFLDLRSPSSRPNRNRPLSAQSKTRASSSVNTQGKISTATAKDVFPGLQRLISNFNQKKVVNTSFRKTINAKSQPIDSRFRRRVEENVLVSKSDSSIRESKRENARSSEATDQDSSTQNEEVVEKNSEEPQIKPSIKKLKEEFEKQRTQPVASKNYENPDVRKEKHDVKFDVEEPLQTMKEEKTNELPLEKIVPVQLKQQKKVNETVNATSDEAIKSMVRECNVIKKNLQKLDWYDPSLVLPQNIRSLPSFKRSWTIPSLHLMKRDPLWAKHYNALCTKVDRKTYEFDDDADSLDSMDRMSSYSSVFKSNYMNLIFCFGCVGGILLIAGILTASEVQNDLHYTTEESSSIYDLIIYQVSYPIRVIYNIVYQTVTFPNRKFFKQNTEPPRYWGLF